MVLIKLITFSFLAHAHLIVLVIVWYQLEDMMVHRRTSDSGRPVYKPVKYDFMEGCFAFCQFVCTCLLHLLYEEAKPYNSWIFSHVHASVIHLQLFGVYDFQQDQDVLCRSFPRFVQKKKILICISKLYKP